MLSFYYIVAVFKLHIHRAVSYTHLDVYKRQVYEHGLGHHRCSSEHFHIYIKYEFDYTYDYPFNGVFLSVSRYCLNDTYDKADNLSLIHISTSGEILYHGEPITENFSAGGSLKKVDTSEKC